MTQTNGVTSAIILYLAVNGHVAHRNNTTGIFDPTTKKFRRIAAASKGVGDVLCCLKGGRYLEIEVKTGKDTISPEQSRRRDRILRNRGIYIIVKSFDDFLKQFEKTTGRTHVTDTQRTDTLPSVLGTGSDASRERMGGREVVHGREKESV